MSGAQPTLVIQMRDSDARNEAMACAAQQRIAQHGAALGVQLEQFQRHMSDNDCGQQIAARSLALSVYGDLASMSLLWLLGAPFGSANWYTSASDDEAFRERGVLAIVQLCDQLCARVVEILSVCRAEAQRQRHAHNVLLDATPARLAQLESVVSVLRAIGAIKQACRQRVSAMPVVMAQQSAAFFKHTRLAHLVREMPVDEPGECPVCADRYDDAEHRAQAPLCCGAKQRLCRVCWLRSAQAGSNSGRRDTFQCPFCKTQHSLYGGGGGGTAPQLTNATTLAPPLPPRPPHTTERIPMVE